MTNDKNLTQPNNQEVILEEISEEELEGVTGGGLFGEVLGRVSVLVDNLGKSLDIFVG
ncbi:MAG: hypothetical protein V7K77_02655 [Nostoc sp.]|uniref:hypothetical protein n=1 Tax=Nostoc sp. TaxID=1180 RepID=UPI002FF69406